jgi:hypothetical protein
MSKRTQAESEAYLAALRAGDYTRTAKQNGYMRRIHGVNSEEYETLLARQGGKCALCGTTDPKGPIPGQFVFDHDHTTGKIRGLLCNCCNTGLGMFEDSVEALTRAVRYLALSATDFSIESQPLTAKEIGIAAVREM